MSAASPRCQSLLSFFAVLSLALAGTTAGLSGQVKPPALAPSSGAIAASAPAPTPATAPAPTAAADDRGLRPAPAVAGTPVFAQPTVIDAVVDRIVGREHATVNALRRFTPRVETYIQVMRPDKELGSAPERDVYFLGRVDMRKRIDDREFLGIAHRSLRHLLDFKYSPAGFVQMTLPDASQFDRQHYQFTYIGREFLGDVRCLVFDVSPRKGAGSGRFQGRVWAEDQGYTLVRFNGTYTDAPLFGMFLHFDSWRSNVQPGLWLPSVIYSEESDKHYRKGFVFNSTLRYKAQTRFWGYKLGQPIRATEFTNLTIEAPEVKDQSDPAADHSPLESQAIWERQAQDNVLQRMERAGLLAPVGEMDKVLDTVVNNLEVTNNLNLPDVQCRVLLTTPFESFTIGQTIIMSRGLIDVLPDEASLAMVLSHELAHLALGHRLDTKYAFHDRMQFPDEASFERLQFRHNEFDEAAADTKAMALLKNSPYKDSLARAGLFLRQLDARASQLHELIAAHIGDSLVADGHVVRLTAILNAAPQLQTMRIDELAALQLGARVKIDPWTDELQLIKAKPFPIIAERQKMPFELTPFRPHLTRLSTPLTQPVAGAAR